MPKPKRIDLTDKKALVSAFKKHHEELWASFGTAPLYKDYDVNKVIEFINNIIEKEHAHISPQKKDEIFLTLQKYGNDVKRAMQYIANVFLRGSGLGLNDHQEKLLRNVIKEEIRKTLKEENFIGNTFKAFKKIRAEAPGRGIDFTEVVGKVQKIDGNKVYIETPTKNIYIISKADFLNKNKFKNESVLKEDVPELHKSNASSIKYAEGYWDDQDSEDEKNHFFKKFKGLGFPWNITTKRDKIMGKSFKELPKPVQQAWEYYIHKMK